MEPHRPDAGNRGGGRTMNITIRNPNMEPPDEEDRNKLQALLAIYPMEAIGDDDDHGDLVDVVMVGRGDGFMERAKDYQNRYAAAVAEWEAWDNIKEGWTEKHDAKCIALEVKYELSIQVIDRTRFKIVEVQQ
jgi:hypothetical protein